jgi:hypothetical protein
VYYTLYGDDVGSLNKVVPVQLAFPIALFWQLTGYAGQLPTRYSLCVCRYAHTMHYGYAAAHYSIFYSLPVVFLCSSCCKWKGLSRKQKGKSMLRPKRAICPFPVKLAATRGRAGAGTTLRIGICVWRKTAGQDRDNANTIL